MSRLGYAGLGSAQLGVLKDEIDASAFEFFPLDLAEEVRQDYPQLWAKHGTGGNPPTAWTGDNAYQAYKWLHALLNNRQPWRNEAEVELASHAFQLLTRGHFTEGTPKELFTEVASLWLTKREKYASRHQRDFRPGGIIAAIKWGVILPWAMNQSGNDVDAASALMVENLGTKR